MRAQVSGQCVAPAAGIVAEGALEGLLACVQLNVPQQVPLLREGHATLAAREGSVSCRQRDFEGGGCR